MIKSLIVLWLPKRTTILFVASTICTSKSLVITNETTNTIMPIIIAKVVPIVPKYDTKPIVINELMDAIRKDIMIK